MHLSFLRWSLALAVALLLTACASPETLPPGLAVVAPAPANLPPSKTVELTIYRPRRFMGMGLHPTVRMNGQDLVTVPNGTVFRAHLAPGRYVFDVDGHESGAALDTKPGEAYYFRVGVEAGMWVGNGTLTLVAPQQGSFESGPLKRVDRDEIDSPAFR